MPNVLHSPRRLAVRLVPRVLLQVVTKRNRRALATSASAHTGVIIASAPLTGQPPAVALSSNLASGSIGGIVGRRSQKAKGAAKETAKDVLLLGLEALVQSADAFPPLKSVVGGLLFFTTQIELVSSNKEQILDIYAQIDAFAESLVCAILDTPVLSSTHEAAIRALAKDVQAVCVDAEAVARQRPFTRFLRAKRQSAQLGRLMKRLDRANESFTRTMLSSVEVTASEILASVQPLRGEVHRLTRTGKYFFFDIAFPLDRSWSS